MPPSITGPLARTGLTGPRRGFGRQHVAHPPAAADCRAAGSRVLRDNSEAQLRTARALQTEFGLEFPLLHGNAETSPSRRQLRLGDLGVRRQHLVRSVSLDPRGGPTATSWRAADLPRQRASSSGLTMPCSALNAAQRRGAVIRGARYRSSAGSRVGPVSGLGVGFRPLVEGARQRLCQRPSRPPGLSHEQDGAGADDSEVAGILGDDHPIGGGGELHERVVWKVVGAELRRCRRVVPGGAQQVGYPGWQHRVDQNFTPAGAGARRRGARPARAPDRSRLLAPRSLLGGRRRS